jgi:hypothetical protein
MIIISHDYAVALPTVDANLPLIGYRNLVTESNVASTTEDSDYPLLNLAGPETFLKWKGTDVDSDEVITFTSPGGMIDYIGIAKHNLGSTGRSVEITATLSGSPAVSICEGGLFRDRDHD